MMYNVKLVPREGHLQFSARISKYLKIYRDHIWGHCPLPPMALNESNVRYILVR